MLSINFKANWAQMNTRTKIREKVGILNEISACHPSPYKYEYKSFVDISVVLIRVILHSNMAFNLFKRKFNKTNQKRNRTTSHHQDFIWFIEYIFIKWKSVFRIKCTNIVPQIDTHLNGFFCSHFSALE